MDMLLVGLRLLLATVLIVSAVAKLLDLSGSRAALRGFGVPERLVPAGALALPVVEGTIAVSLLFSGTALAGALSALGLFHVFTVGVANQLRQGNAPACHCFGALSKEPVSHRTLTRNAGLIVLAAAATGLGWQASAPGIEELGDVSSMVAVWLAVIVTATALAVVTWLSMRRVLVTHRRLVNGIDLLAQVVGDQSSTASKRSPAPVAMAGVPRGSPALSDIQVPLLDGRTISTHRGTSNDRSLVLLLTAETCVGCHTLLPDIAQWQRDLAPDNDLVLVGKATGASYRPTIERHGIGMASLPDAETFERLMNESGSSVVPSLIVIRGDGIPTRPAAMGVDAVRAALAALAPTMAAASEGSTPRAADLPGAETSRHHDVPQIGTPVPSLVLIGQDGLPTDLSLAARQTALTLVLFWRDDCPHCAGLLPTVRSWREGLDPDRMQVVAITAGSVAEVAALGIADRTLADPDYAAHNVFGAIGSPSAILLDREGRFASKLVAGARELTIALDHIRGPLVRSAATVPETPVPAAAR